MSVETRETGDRPELADPDRRAALAKMGKFAGVTAPAVVALLTADASSAWAVSGRGGHSGPGGPRFPGHSGGPGRPGGPLGWLLGVIFR